MTEDHELSTFARVLVQRVRDRAIEACDQLNAGQVRGPAGERWSGLAQDGPVHQALAALIPDIVDQVLFQLLNSLDNGELPLGWRREDGTWISLEELGGGEMAGWLMMGNGGWLESYSNERFFDPLAELRLEP